MIILSTAVIFSIAIRVIPPELNMFIDNRIYIRYTIRSLYDIMIHLRDSLVNNLIKHAEGQIAKHKANVEIYFTYPSGIGEHPDIMGAIETELNEISRYHEQITVLKEYFDA